MNAATRGLGSLYMLLQALVVVTMYPFTKRWLQALYLHGPQLAGIGGWESEPYYEICHAMTREPALTFLRLNPNTMEMVTTQECLDMVKRRMDAYILLVMSGALGYTLIKVITYWWHYYTHEQPREQAMKEMLSEFATELGGVLAQRLQLPQCEGEKDKDGDS